MEKILLIALSGASILNEPSGIVPEIVLGSLIWFKVCSLIRGYWATPRGFLSLAELADRMETRGGIGLPGYLGT